MRQSGAIVFIAVGLILLYIGVTGKYKCLIAMLDCVAVPNSLLTGEPIQEPGPTLQQQSSPSKPGSIQQRVKERLALPGILTPPTFGQGV